MNLRRRERDPKDGTTTDSESRAGARLPEGLAKQVRLVILDVDGVLTDAGVYVGAGPGGEALELKRFDIQDGLGIRLLREVGLEVALVSGRASLATTLRAQELGLQECHQVEGARKLPVVREMVTRLGLEWSQVCLVADDLADLPVLRKVGLPVAVGNAVPEVRREAVWTTRRTGGYGAVREFARVLLEARGEWDRAVDGYCTARSDE